MGKKPARSGKRTRCGGKPATGGKRTRGGGKPATGGKRTRDGNKTPNRDDFFKRNLEALKTVTPGGHAVLSGLSDIHSQLVFGDDGEPDIEFRGSRLYGKGATRHAKEQVDEYFASPTRMLFSPPASGNMDPVGADYVYRILRRAVDDGIELTYVPSDDETHFLLVFGVGLGGHIEPLVERTNCKSLILIEPNTEFLYHSMFFFDWAGMIEKFTNDDDKQLYISISKNPDSIYSEIMTFVRGHGAPFFDGTMVFNHYNNSTMELAMKMVKADANVMVSGLGFLEDEMLMINNSFNNLCGYDSLVFRKMEKSTRMPVFVIGSGPSIDTSLDVIGENRNNAILVSCGSALGVLVGNGIVPDFQIEMENVPIVYDLLRDKADKYDISDICLVASTTIDPRVKDIFPKKVLFFRPALSSWAIFSLGDGYSLYEVGPTVSNTGLSFAAGFSRGDIYLFGVDFGTTLKEVHHSKDSDYRPGGVAEYTPDPFNMERRGNFGGTVFTHGTFLWARTAAETTIRRFRRGMNYFNCSNGVAIEGTVPRLPGKVSLPGGFDKDREIESILEGFEQYSRGTFEKSWSREDWAGAVEELCDRLLECLDVEDDEYKQRYLAKMNRILAPPGISPTAEQMLCRGSIMMCIICGTYYLARVSKAGKTAAMEDIVRSEMRRVIDGIKEVAAKFLRDLEESRIQ